jgi:hypothetical protein
MKKPTLILTFFLAFATGLNAQDCKKGWNSSLGLASQHWSRGVAYTVAPTFEGDLNYMFCEGLTLGSEAVIALNNVTGYGNEFNTYMTITKKELSLTVKDYFYLYGYGAEDNFYGNWGESTQHFIEGSLKYKKDNYYGLVAYTFMQNNSIDRNGVYFEAGYKTKSNIEFSAGYVTDYSAVNWRQKAGITHMGVSHTRDLKISKDWTSKMKTGLYLNPSYEDVSDYAGISRTPVNAVISMTF